MKFYLFTAILSLFGLMIPAAAQKMKPDEIIQKHLDSIGSVEARAAANNRIAVGNGTVKSISQKNSLVQGRMVLASSGNKMYLGMNLNSPDYPFEKFSFDGDKTKISFVRPGIRSVLGNFVAANRGILEEGLLGGTLSASWALIDISGKNPKVTYAGTKKIDGKETYVLDYSPKNGSDLDIKLYFEKDTFHHIRTEYKRTASATIGTSPNQSSGFSETRFKITENFSDYKNEKGINLPHDYVLNYSITGQNGTTEIEWGFNFSEFAYKQNFSADSFDAESNQ